MSEARAQIPSPDSPPPSAGMRSGLAAPATPDVVLPSPSVGGMPSPLARSHAPSSQEQPPPGGVPPELIRTILQLEGSGDDSVSPEGAIGKGQIMPGTAAMYGVTRDQLFDPEINRRVMNQHVHDLWNKYHDQTAVKIAYNAGSGVADKWLASGKDPSILPAETQRYIGMKDIWSHSGGLSPEARALVGMSQEHLASFEQESGRLRREIERISAEGPPDS